MSRGHRKPLGQHLISIMQNSSRNIIIMHSIGGFRNKMRVIFLDILEADDLAIYASVVAFNPEAAANSRQ